MRQGLWPLPHSRPNPFIFMSSLLPGLWRPWNLHLLLNLFVTIWTLLGPIHDY